MFENDAVALAVAPAFDALATVRLGRWQPGPARHRDARDTFQPGSKR